MVDKNGGISHWDTRESKKESGRRRWVVQEEGRGAKLGGISVNRKLPFTPFFFNTKCLEGKSYSIDAVYDLHGR